MDLSAQLIMEVQKYTMLYNMNSQGYFNTKKKERVWSIIARRIHSEVPQIKQKWKHLRDMYMRFKKRLESGTPPARNRPWKYYKMLNFLDEYSQKKVVDWETIVEVDKDGNKKDNVHRLIEEVRKHEVIYSLDAPGYSDREVKEDMWREISESVNIDVLACKHKWKGLRDSYKRFQRKNTTGSDQPKWKYYDSLYFLEYFPAFRSNTSAAASANDSSMSPTREIGDGNSHDEESLLHLEEPKVIIENHPALEEEYIKEEEYHDEEYSTIEPIKTSTSPLPNGSYVIEEKIDDVNICEANSDIKDFYCLEVQNNSVDENRMLQDVPILYLQEQEDSSNDSLSIASNDGSAGPMKKRKRSETQKPEPEFIDIFKKSMNDFAACNKAENCNRNDSVNILFDSLAYSIKNAQLSPDQLMALQSDICAYAYVQLEKYKKSSSSSTTITTTVHQ